VGKKVMTLLRNQKTFFLFRAERFGMQVKTKLSSARNNQALHTEQYFPFASDPNNKKRVLTLTNK